MLHKVSLNIFLGFNSFFFLNKFTGLVQNELILSDFLFIYFYLIYNFLKVNST